MSFLPYGRTTPGTWVLSGAASLALHGALIAMLSANLAALMQERRAEPERPDFKVTLEQLETDALADLVNTLDGSELPAETGDLVPEDIEGLAGEDLAALSPDDLDAAVPDALETTEVEALAPEDPAVAETGDAETLEASEPEPAAPEALEPETLEAEAPEPVAPEPEAPEEIIAEPEIAEAEATELEAVAAETLTPEPEVPEIEEIVAETPEAPVEEIAALEPVPDVPEPPVAEPLTPTIDDLSALLPEEGVTATVPEASPLITEDGTGAAPVLDLDAAPAAPTEDLLPVIPDGAAPIVAGSDLDTAVPVPEAPEEIAALEAAPVDLRPATPETPDLTAITPTEPETQDEPEEPQEEELANLIEPLAPVEPDGGVEAIEPVPEPPAAPPRRVPRTPPTARDIAVAELIRRIQASPPEPCLLALPRRAGADGIGLALIAAEDGTMSAYAEALLTAEGDADIRQSRLLIDQRQCPALGFVAENRDYPATRIGISLERAEVPSGNRLSGVLRGVGDRNLALLLIDNNGVVQDLGRFTTRDSSGVRFDVPVTRVGPRRDTRQLLLAVASDESVDKLTGQSGEQAVDVFRDLSAGLIRNAALAVIAFDVR